MERWRIPIRQTTHQFEVTKGQTGWGVGEGGLVGWRGGRLGGVGEEGLGFGGETVMCTNPGFEGGGLGGEGGMRQPSPNKNTF